MITVIVTLIVVMLLLWVLSLIPGDPTIKKWIRVLVIVGAVLWTIDAFGGFRYVGINLPHAHPTGCG